MKKAIYMTVMLSIISYIGMALNTNAQNRVSRQSVKALVKNIEGGADKFKRSLDKELDNSRIDGRQGEDRINDFVKDFENATDRLVRDYDNDEAAREVLQRGMVIDKFMRRARLSSGVEREWSMLRRDLDKLARMYRISWKWDNDANDDNSRTERRNNDGSDRENGSRDNRRSDRRNAIRNNRRNDSRDSQNSGRINYDSVQKLVGSIEAKANQFKRALDKDLDRSRVDGKRTEERINNYVAQFENATDRMREDFRDSDRGGSSVREVLQRGKTINDAMQRLQGSTDSKRIWNSLRNDLNQLAAYYQVSWRWNN